MSARWRDGAVSIWGSLREPTRSVPAPPEEDPTAPPAPTKRKKKRRWVLRVFQVLGGTLVLLVLAAHLVLSNLEQSDLKAFVRATALEEAGVTLDYAALSVSMFSGAIEGDGVTLGGPAEGYTVRAATVRGEVDVAALLGGEVVVPSLALTGVEVELGGPDVAESTDPSGPLELSTLLESLGALGITAHDLTVEVETLRWRDAAEAHSVVLGPFSMAGSVVARDGAPGATQTELRVLPGSAQLEVVAEELAPHTPLRATVSPALSLTVADRVSLECDIGLQSSNVPSL